MSLTTWFREYVYIPLGGNRKGAARRNLNIMIVWALTGLWHGAGWNFVLWGIWFGILLILHSIEYMLGILTETDPCMQIPEPKKEEAAET